MNIFRQYKGRILDEVGALAEAGEIPAGLDAGRITVEPPREEQHGDLATNAALVLAKQAKMKPRELADLLAPRLQALEDVRAVEVAGPGFINLRLVDGVWLAHLATILEAGTEYGAADIGRGERVNV